MPKLTLYGAKGSGAVAVEAALRVAGQDYELNNIPRTGSLRDASAVLRRRGDVGRKKLRGAP